MKRWFKAIVERDTSWAGAPCDGFIRLRQLEGWKPESSDIVNAASIPLDGVSFDDEIEVTITVEIVKKGKRSRKWCHNTWPAHVHNKDKKTR